MLFAIFFEGVIVFAEDEFYFEALREVVIKRGFKDRGFYNLYKEVSKTNTYLISYKDEILTLNKVQYPNGWDLTIIFYKGHAISFDETFSRREGNKWKIISRTTLEEREAIEKAERFISEVENYGGFK
jgi:hypothetical protein